MQRAYVTESSYGERAPLPSVACLDYVIMPFVIALVSNAAKLPLQFAFFQQRSGIPIVHRRCQQLNVIVTTACLAATSVSLDCGLTRWGLKGAQRQPAASCSKACVWN